MLEVGETGKTPLYMMNKAFFPKLNALLEETEMDTFKAVLGCVCVCVCVCLCVCVCVYIQNVYVCMYKHTHTHTHTHAYILCTHVHAHIYIQTYNRCKVSRNNAAFDMSSKFITYFFFFLRIYILYVIY